MAPFEQSPHMNPGEDETSYARNSAFQRAVQDRMKTLIEEAITGLFATTSTRPLNNMTIADLGCSSGPNALTLASAAADAVHRHCAQHAQLPPPEMSIFLNDLPGSDFNTVAKILAALKKHSDEDLMTHPVVFSSMVPGSFYERLFACGSLHLVCSSNSLTWISKAPDDLKESRIPMYDSDESLRLSRRQIVTDSYAQQFRKDFRQFLSLRAQELVPRGQMVISVYVRCSDKPNSDFTQPWEPVLISLNDMALRGMISKEKINSFYIPSHCPLDKEVNKIIEDEGSFEINKSILIQDLFIGVDKSFINPKMIALGMRAAYEPLIVHHFGSSKEMIDEFTRTLERHMSTVGMEALMAAEYPLAFMCLSLTRAT